ncbi:hypothetical protein LCGC14_1410450 [marine sediment metagenome]|uniref:Uncharacterized protein n=1 Tax=marine sediment metagenome TaxID=412755 RepID=A0A0F9MW42_9ZZZZ
MSQEQIQDFEYHRVDQAFIEAHRGELTLEVAASVQRQMDVAIRNKMWLYYLQLQYKGRAGCLYTMMNPQMANDLSVSVELYLKEIAHTWAVENWTEDEFE